MITTVTYSFAFFMPIILRDGLGFSVAASQCLVAPPYVLSGFLMYATSWWGDKYKMRMPMLVLNTCISLIGLPMMAFATSQPVRYLGVFIGAAGVNANVPSAMVCVLLRRLIRGQGLMTCLGIPSEQHSRPMEARFLLGHTHWPRRRWWHRRQLDLPFPGCPRLRARLHRRDCVSSQSMTQKVLSNSLISKGKLHGCCDRACLDRPLQAPQ